MNKITLYKKDAKGALRFWSVEGDDFLCELYIEYGQVGGKIQEKTEDVILKGNNDAETQVISRMNSRVNKQRDKGYISNKDEAMQETENKGLSGASRPMLALRRKEQDVSGWCGQLKYDGHRCIIGKDSTGKIFAVSKNGKIIDSIDHILKGIRIPNDVELDGELYHHGTALQTIGSWVKRKQENSLKLKYICYDAIIPGKFSTRYDKLLEMRSDNCFFENIVIASTWFNISNEDIPIYFKKAKDDGYEGLMVRDPDGLYESGKKSKNILKVKGCIDGEFLVLDVIPSVDGWGRLKCAMPNGKTFTTSAPGTHLNKINILNNKEEYIGRMVKLEYANLTEEGKPFHPVATGWREKQSE